MSVRSLLIAATLALPTWSVAQESKPASKPATADAEVQGVVETPQDRVARLKKRLERLDRELSYLKQVHDRGGFIDRVHDRLSARAKPPHRSIGERVKAGTERREPRLMTLGEKRRHPSTTHFVVSGKPVKESSFQKILEFVRRHEKDVPTARRQTFDSLIKATAAFAADVESVLNGTNVLSACRHRIEAGADFEAEMKSASEGPNASVTGALPPIRRDAADAAFVYELFRLEVGEVSKVLVSTTGTHLVQCIKKTDDTIWAWQISRPHSALSQKAVRDVDAGTIEIAFRDEQDRALWAAKK